MAARMRTKSPDGTGLGSSSPRKPIFSERSPLLLTCRLLPAPHAPMSRSPESRSFDFTIASRILFLSASPQDAGRPSATPSTTNTAPPRIL